MKYYELNRLFLVTVFSKGLERINFSEFSPFSLVVTG